MEVFRRQLRELGYVEGKNIVFEERWAEGKLDRLGDLAAELVRRKVDVLVTFGGAGPATAAKKATSTIPIVMAATGSDPVKAGLVASLARPGGNITGLANIFTELRGKQVELLKETIPKLSRVAIIWNPDSPAGAPQQKDTESDARALGLRFQSLEVRKAEDFENVFQAAKKERARRARRERVEVLDVVMTGWINSHRPRLVNLAANTRLPTMYSSPDAVFEGGHMSYAADPVAQTRRAATYVAKILKGTKPADLPVQQPMKFEFVINLKTAKQIGLTIPPNVLARANRVIK